MSLNSWNCDTIIWLASYYNFYMMPIIVQGDYITLQDSLLCHKTEFWQDNAMF